MSTNKECFVCNKKVKANETTINLVVNLPVCNKCKGTTREMETAEEFLDSLADDLVCGCI